MTSKKPAGLALLALISIALLALTTPDKGLKATLHYGTPDVQSINTLTFGPEDILFLGDTRGAAVFAVEVEGAGEDRSTEPVNIENLDRKIAALLGTSPTNIHIGDVAVHPASQQIYLSVTRGEGQRGWGRVRGSDMSPVLLRVSRDGRIEEVSLEGVRFSKAEIPSPPDPSKHNRGGTPLRTFTLLDMDFIDGEVYLSGLSNEEFSSTLRRISFPFEGRMAASSLEIFHTAHGRYETHAPINTFAPYREGGKTKILGAFSCTPLVAFPLDQPDAAHVKGTTVAELGAGNHPLDIMSYEEGGKGYFLLANHLHGFMKIEQDEIVGAGSLTRATGRAGTRPKVLPHKNVVRVVDLNAEYVAVVQRDEDAWHLRSLAKASL